MDIKQVHLVEFAQCQPGTYELMWAQLDSLRWIRRAEEGTPVYDVLKDGPLADAPDVSAVLRAIQRVVERHEALRSTCPDVRAAEPRQVVHEGGQLEVREYEAPDGDMEQCVKSLFDTMVGERFGPDDLPVRFVIFTRDGAAVWLAMVIHHMFADGIASAVVYEEICRYARDPGADLPLHWQPREIVAFERSPAGQRHAEKAAAFLMRQLMLVPSRGERPHLPKPGPDGFTFTWVCMDSPAVAAASVLLGRRYDVSEAAVILTGFLRALGSWTGEDVCPVRLACANRDQPTFRRSVANLWQQLPVTIDLRSGSFADLVRHVGAATLRGYRYGRYDPVRFDEAVAQAQDRRNVTIRVPYAVNLRTVGQSDLDGEEAERDRMRLLSYAELDPAGVRALASRTSLRQEFTRASDVSDNVRFGLWQLDHTAGMTLWGDETAINTEGPAEILQGLEDALLRAVADAF